MKLPPTRARYGFPPEPEKPKLDGRVSSSMDLAIDRIEAAERADRLISGILEREYISSELREKCEEALLKCQDLADTAGEVATAMGALAELSFRLANMVVEIKEEARE